LNIAQPHADWQLFPHIFWHFSFAIFVLKGSLLLSNFAAMKPLQHPPDPIRSVAIVGLGAIGTLYAARIAAIDADNLRIVADPRRIQGFRDRPPSFNGTPLRLAYASPDAPGAPADLVLIAVKAASLPSALDAIAPFLHKGTQILPLLNGVESQDRIAAVFGWPRTLRGFVFCNSAMRDGHDVRQQGAARIVFGEASNDPPAPRVKAVADYFARIGVDHHVPADMRFAQWRKFILNVGLNQAEALLRVPHGGLQRSPAAMRLARELMDEAATVAHAEGVADARGIPDWVEGVVRTLPPEDKTSMLQDVEAGRPSEVDVFAGVVCRLGRAHGIPTPANERALRLLTLGGPG
jgi:2-dehydropantoate 2-reductase